VSSTAAGIAVKKKAPKMLRSRHGESQVPDGHENKPVVPFRPCSKENLDELAADIETGIRDLPVWKDHVRRLGLKRTRQILWRGILIRLLTDGKPQN
jgi:hypothetical protein